MAEQMHVLRWEKPPPAQHCGRPAGTTHSRWATAAKELIENAGIWGVIHEGPAAKRSSAGFPAAIRSGLYLAFAPAGSFEAVARERGGVRVVYARYVGDEGDGDA